MTQTQKQALHEMNGRYIGAIRTRIGWTWAEDVRQSDAAADAVLAAIGKPPQPIGMPPVETIDVKAVNATMLADLLSFAQEIANDPKVDLIQSDRRIRLYSILSRAGVL